MKRLEYIVAYEASESEENPSKVHGNRVLYKEWKCICGQIFETGYICEDRMKISDLDVLRMRHSCIWKSYSKFYEDNLVSTKVHRHQVEFISAYVKFSDGSIRAGNIFEYGAYDDSDLPKIIIDGMVQEINEQKGKTECEKNRRGYLDMMPNDVWRMIVDYYVK